MSINECIDIEISPDINCGILNTEHKESSYRRTINFLEGFNFRGTMLHQGILRGESVLTLLECGADPNKPMNFKYSNHQYSRTHIHNMKIYPLDMCQTIEQLKELLSFGTRKTKSNIHPLHDITDPQIHLIFLQFSDYNISFNDISLRTNEELVDIYAEHGRHDMIVVQLMNIDNFKKAVDKNRLIDPLPKVLYELTVNPTYDYMPDHSEKVGYMIEKGIWYETVDDLVITKISDQYFDRVVAHVGIDNMGKYRDIIHTNKLIYLVEQGLTLQRTPQNILVPELLNKMIEADPTDWSNEFTNFLQNNCQAYQDDYEWSDPFIPGIIGVYVKHGVSHTLDHPIKVHDNEIIQELLDHGVWTMEELSNRAHDVSSSLTRVLFIDHHETNPTQLKKLIKMGVPVQESHTLVELLSHGSIEKEGPEKQEYIEFTRTTVLSIQWSKYANDIIEMLINLRHYFQVVDLIKHAYNDGNIGDRLLSNTICELIWEPELWYIVDREIQPYMVKSYSWGQPHIDYYLPKQKFAKKFHEGIKADIKLMVNPDEYFDDDYIAKNTEMYDLYVQTVREKIVNGEFTWPNYEFILDIFDKDQLIELLPHIPTIVDMSWFVDKFGICSEIIPYQFDINSTFEKVDIYGRRINNHGEYWENEEKPIAYTVDWDTLRQLIDNGHSVNLRQFSMNDTEVPYETVFMYQRYTPIKELTGVLVRKNQHLPQHLMRNIMRMT